MEEEHGLARHAMQVYSRATKAVPPEEKLTIYNIYLQHAQQIYGITKTREIYQVKGWDGRGGGGHLRHCSLFHISIWHHSQSVAINSFLSASRQQMYTSSLDR